MKYIDWSAIRLVVTGLVLGGIIALFSLLAGNAWGEETALKSNVAQATAPDVQERKAAHIQKRLTAARRRTYPFTIYFPWGRCRGSYTSTVRYPRVISGYLCGTYTVCRLMRAPRYLCRF